MGPHLLRIRRGLAPLAAALLVATGCSHSAKAATTTTTSAPVKATTTTVVNPDDALKINQIQVIGTHNSYHIADPPKELALLAKLSPSQAAQREYSHPPLPVQFGQEKIRQIELDVYVDTKGGLYAHPVLRREAGLGPYDVPAMEKPGVKVLHEQDVDYHSVCPTLEMCLTQTKAWSDAHPDHVPLFIDIDFKNGPLIFNVPGQAKPEPWTPAAMDALDAQILSVFPRNELITPDDVRGSYPTLEDAVKAGNWPTLGQSRGKVMFLITNPEPYRSIYLVGHPDLVGRVMFTNAMPGEPDAAYVEMDDPTGMVARIQALVKEGYLVRTESDSRDVQGKTDDTTQRDAALASGAQIVSTDYPGPDGAKAQYGTDYKVELPGFVAARCNPVIAPPTCRDTDLEPGK